MLQAKNNSIALIVLWTFVICVLVALVIAVWMGKSHKSPAIQPTSSDQYGMTVLPWSTPG